MSLGPNSFVDKNVFISEAAGAVASDLAGLLNEMGANVIVSFTDKLSLERFNRVYPKIEAILVDVANWDEVERKLKPHLERTDYLVNCLHYLQTQPFGSITREAFDRMIKLNFSTPLHVMQLVIEGMKKRKSGVIINVSGISALTALDGHAGYGSAKSALDMVTKVAAKELAPYNIRVNSVNPFSFNWKKIIEFYGKKEYDQKVREEIREKLSIKREGMVEDIIYPIIFLMSNHSSAINGISLAIDGGYTAN